MHTKHPLFLGEVQPIMSSLML